jgi:hypothetical protein
MTPSRPTRLDFVKRPGFLLYVVSWVVLVSVISSLVSAWQRTGPQTSPAANQPDPFDLRFPVGIEPGHEGLQPERDPIDTRSTASSKTPSEQVRAPESTGRGVDPRRLRRIMDLGVTRYASATDDGGKSKGVSLVQLAALLGYPPARQLVVRNYPRSPAVRSTVPAQDAVRFAVDLLAREGAFDENAELVIALGNYFSRRGEVLIFGRHIVDAIAHDDRLRASDGLAKLFSVFARVPGVCTGIKRAISADLRIDQDCSNSLIEELLDYARLKAEVGIDAEARVRAMRLLAEFEETRK